MYLDRENRLRAQFSSYFWEDWVQINMVYIDLPPQQNPPLKIPHIGLYYAKIDDMGHFELPCLSFLSMHNVGSCGVSN